MKIDVKANIRKIERYEDLIQLGRITSSSLNFRNIIKKAQNSIAKLLSCEKVFIYRKDQNCEEMVFEIFGEHQGSDVRIPIKETTFVGSCAHYLATLHISEPQRDLRLARGPEIEKDFVPRNILLFPLVSNGQLLGVVEAINSFNQDFDAEDVHFSEAISNQLTQSMENALLFEKVKRQFLQVVESMADAIGKKDSYTGGHTKRVGHFAEMIARELDLSYEDMSELKLAAVLHDIGKIGIEDAILKKKAPLTDAEFDIMKDHPRLGFEILGHIDGMESVINAMRFHHERPDGKGYPYGLSGEEIPLLAMIISVADTFDAMISTRPYRKGLSPMVAYEEIMKNAGTQFSVKVAQAFEKGFVKTKMYRQAFEAEKKKAS